MTPVESPAVIHALLGNPSARFLVFISGCKHLACLMSMTLSSRQCFPFNEQDGFVYDTALTENSCLFF